MATVAPAFEPGSWRAWWMACRPQTLPVAVAPVAVGTTAAFADGSGRPFPALAALTGALLLQIGANLANDCFDFEKGADTEKRLGPPRARQLGLLSSAQLKGGFGAAFGAATILGVYLCSVGGWPIAGIGILSIIAAVAYTAGPFPLGYHGLGDPVVFIFFGVIAVGGTYYVQTLTLSPQVLIASLPMGCLATAILVVNNLRDIDTDREVGKRTLAARLGRTATRIEYTLLVFLAYALLPVLANFEAVGTSVMIPLVSLPWALALIRTVSTRSEGPPLNAALVGTARLELGFAILLCAGWLI